MKRILDKYIAHHVLSSIGLVLLMLAGIEGFILFVGELGSIGQGNYDVLSALIFIALQLPYQVYLFFPIACLLGILLGMGVMASNNELVVMQAGGISQKSIIFKVFRVIGLLVLTLFFLGELVFPSLIHNSEEFKTSLKSEGQAIRTENGLWFKSSNNFIHIENIVNKKQLNEIYQYQFNKVGQLKLVRFIERADYDKDHWQLTNIKESFLPLDMAKQKRIIKKVRPSGEWEINISPNLLEGEENNPSEMNLWHLGRLVIAQHAANVGSSLYELNFWRRLFQPLATFVMVMVGLPFIFGSTRSISTSQRFMLGTVVGFAFHILNRFTIPLSQIYPIDPLLLAALPIILFLILGLVIIQLRPMQS